MLSSKCVKACSLIALESEADNCLHDLEVSEDKNETCRLVQEVGRSTPQPPNLNTAIQTSTHKRIRTLGVELDLHHIMRMPLKELSAFKSTIPIPEFDRHIVRR